MDKIYLIGDSIRVGGSTTPGYGAFVKEKLAGRAEVYAPTANCAYAQVTQRNLHEWVRESVPEEVAKEDFALVHWNNDLFAVTETFPDSLRSDGIHFGEGGSRLLADAVVRRIEEVLATGGKPL